MSLFLKNKRCYLSTCQCGFYQYQEFETNFLQAPQCSQLFYTMLCTINLREDNRTRIQRQLHFKSRNRTIMTELRCFPSRKLKSFHIHRTKTTSQQHDKKKTTTDNENKKKMWGITIGTLCLVLFRICLDTRLKVLLIALESFSTEKKKLYFQQSNSQKYLYLESKQVLSHQAKPWLH